MPIAGQRWWRSVLAAGAGFHVGQGKAKGDVSAQGFLSPESQSSTASTQAFSELNFLCHGHKCY